MAVTGVFDITVNGRLLPDINVMTNASTLEAIFNETFKAQGGILFHRCL